MPSLILTRRLPDAVEARARRDYTVIDNADDRPLSADAIVARAAQVSADALLVSVGDPIDAELIARLPASIGLIATFSVGTDHIDLAAAAARGIAVANTPDVLTDATAEIALLLMLGAARRAHEGATELRSGRWTGWRPTHLMGTLLAGKRLGIVGMGRIGQAVAARARAFGMILHYHNRRPLAALEVADAQYHPTLEGLLAQSDVLSLHCPANATTRGLIDAAALARLPDGAILINTARGDIVVDSDVIAALKTGRLAAAGLDVFAGEPAIAPGYLDLPNAFLLPHLGSATVETRTAMGNRALDNIDAFFARRPIPFPVTA